MLSTATNVTLATTSIDALVPGPIVDTEVWDAWTAEEPPTAKDYFDALPPGPREDPVPVEDVKIAEELIREIADKIGLFHDESGDPLVAPPRPSSD